MPPRFANSLITQEQAETVACPKCGARPGESCRDVQGRAQNHFDRVRVARNKLTKKRLG